MSYVWIVIGVVLLALLFLWLSVRGRAVCSLSALRTELQYSD